ncbi:MAG TPA: UDP-glucose/GDP-mannose dehydrogenase family protein [Verrucomicrobiae bacterium]|nr:UDP-glucose/GDP-mannose dehydrogenase family protein [Verrucomicrobiae bacterium]
MSTPILAGRAADRVERPLRVCVVGAGYVGLTAAACLAELGHEVGCVETDPVRLAVLRKGGMPIVEEGLRDLIATHVAGGRLTFTDDIADAMPGSEVVLLCVGTPPRADGDPDLRQIARAARQAARAASGDLVLVVKSTVPPGSCEALELLAAGERGDIAVQVASNPEFLREGQAVFDFFHADRIVVGVDNPELAQMVIRLYPRSWPVVVCDRRSAELVKYAANSFLAVKISYANEVASLCEALGADAAQVLGGIGLDVRIGGEFLRPGPGFGGSCLPKDLAGLIAVAASVGRPARLAQAAMAANRDALDRIVAKLEVPLGGLAGARVGLLGLAFKPGTDDFRHSPAVALAARLTDAGATVCAHDPMARVSRFRGDQVDNPYEAARDADAVVVATGWPLYASLDPHRLRQVMRGEMVLDAVGLLDVDAFATAGLEVYGVGRGRPLEFHPVVWRPLEWTLESGATPCLAETAG